MKTRHDVLLADPISRAEFTKLAEPDPCVRFTPLSAACCIRSAR